MRSMSVVMLTLSLAVLPTNIQSGPGWVIAVNIAAIVFNALSIYTLKPEN